MGEVFFFTRVGLFVPGAGVCVCVCVCWFFLLLYTPFSEGAKVPALARARANEKVGERERAGGEKTM